MAARPPWPRFHSADVLLEFVLWSDNPASNCLQLPRFFVSELPAAGPGGLWLQADGCCSRASWVAVEVSVAGNIALARGWQTFARARGLGRRCTLHFKFDGDATSFVREGSWRCPELSQTPPRASRRHGDEMTHCHLRSERGSWS